jgi:hypothetical protein
MLKLNYTCIMKNKNNVIKSIEKIRSKNNKNWMDILRLSFKFAPKQSAILVKKINEHDKKISELLKKLEN